MPPAHQIMHRRKREREEDIADMECIAVMSAIADAYTDDSEGEIMEDAVMRMTVVRWVLDGVVEDKLEAHPGRLNSWWLRMPDAHFEEIVRCSRNSFDIIWLRLELPVNRRGFVTDGRGHSATPYQAAILLFARFGGQDDWKTLVALFNRDRTW